MSGAFNQEYEVISEVGKGNFGTAYKVKCYQDQKIYIAKIVTLQKFSEADRAKALTELNIMKEMKHPHIVGYKESFLDEQELIIVLEYCEWFYFGVDGDASQHIKKRREKGELFSENLILNWLLQLVMALDYIHKKKIVHRDIKSANIFLTSNAVIKLGDFGISKILSETMHSKTFIGTPYYLSPEICLNQKYTSKSDIWSLGCVIFEVASLQYPFQGKNLMGLLGQITSKEPGQIPECYSPGLRSIIKQN